MDQGIHNSGNVVVRRSEAEGGNWICIDGQQRITTATLLVAAIRDCLVSGIEMNLTTLANAQINPSFRSVIG